MEDRDFIDFEFNGHWASEFNLLAVSNGDRYSNSFYGSVNPNAVEMVGKTGVYKWKTQIGEKRFSINIAYDDIDLGTLRKIKEWLNPFVISKLTFKEEPYKYYWVSLADDPEISFLPFRTDDVVVDGKSYKKGVFKGDVTLNFICADNFGYSDWQSFDEDYDYLVEEISDVSNFSFDNGSDNNLIITEIKGNLAQDVVKPVAYTHVEGKNLGLKSQYKDIRNLKVLGESQQEQRSLSQKQASGEQVKLVDVDPNKFIDIFANGNSEQKQYSGKNKLLNNAITRTVGGITFTVKSDKTIIVNGTATSLTQIDIGKPIIGTYRYTGCPSGGNYYNSYRIRIRNSAPPYTEYGDDIGNGIKLTFSEVLDTDMITLTIDSGITVNNLIFKPMISKDGGDYEPYVGGQPSPNPDYPQDIEVVDGYNIVDYKKFKSGNENNWKIEEVENGIKVTRFNEYSSGQPKINLDLKADTEYTCDFIVGEYSKGLPSLVIYKDDVAIKYITYPPYTFRTNSNGKYSIGIVVDPSSYVIIKNIQLIEGKKQKPYLPYGYIGLEQSGKNLFDKSAVAKGYELSAQTGQTIVNSNWYVSDYIEISKLSKIYLSSKGKTSGNANCFYDKDKKFISYQNGINNVSLSVPENAYYFRFNGLIAQLDNDIQIEKGTESTPYEPYHEPKVISINLQGNTLAKVGDIKDKLIIHRNGEVEIEKNTWKDTINTSSLITLNNGNNGLVFTPSKNKTRSISDSDYLITNAQRNKKFNDGTVYQNPTNFVLVGNSSDTLESLQAKFNGGEILYQLETPQIIKLPSINPIELWQGTVNIEIIGNLPTDMNINYNILPAMPSPDAPSQIQNVGDNINLLNKDIVDASNNLRGNALDTGRRLIANKDGTYTYGVFKLGGRELLGKTLGIHADIETTSGNPRISIFAGNSSSLTKSLLKVVLSTSGTGYMTIPSNLNSELDTISAVLYVTTDASVAAGTYVDYTNLKVQVGSEEVVYSAYNRGSLGITIRNENFGDAELLYSQMKNFSFSNVRKELVDNKNCILFLNTQFRSEKGFKGLKFNYKKNTRYVIRGKFRIYDTSITSGKDLWVGAYDKDGNSIGHDNYQARGSEWIQFSFLTDINSSFDHIGFSYGTAEYWCLDMDSLEIYEGTSVREVPKSQVQTITFPLAEGQKLYEGSYLAADGIHNKKKQITYSPASGKEIQSVMTNASTGNTTFIIPNLIANDTKKGESSAPICNQLKGTYNYNYKTFKNQIVQWMDTSAAFCVGMDTDIVGETTDSVINYLKKNPLIIEYLLANEELVPYTTAQRQIYDKLKTLTVKDGYTHLSIDGLGSISLDYNGYDGSPSPAYPSKIRTVGSNINLFDKDNYTELSLQATPATKTLNTSRNERGTYFKCKPNTIYSFQKSTNGTVYLRGNVCETQVIPTDGCSYDNYFSFSSINKISYKTSATAKYIYFNFYCTASDISKQELLNSIKIEEEPENTALSAYNKANVEIKIENANYYNPANGFNYGVGAANTTTVNADGTITTTSNYSNSRGKGTPVYLKKNTNYYLSLELVSLTVSAGDEKHIAAEVIGYNKFGGGANIVSQIFNIRQTEIGTRWVGQFNSGDCDRWALHISGWFGSSNKGTATYKNVMISEQNIDYVPNETQTVTMPIQQELLTGDYIKDTEHHEWGKLIVTGQENWDGYNRSLTNGYFGMCLAKDDVKNTGIVICNKLPQEGGAVYNTTGYGVANFMEGYLYICLRREDFGASDTTSLADCTTLLKAYLAKCYADGDPFIIYYKVKKPVDLELTQEQKNTQNFAKNFVFSYPGTNRVYADNDVVKLSASYVPEQNINIDFMVEGSNLLDSSAFYYQNDIFLKAFEDKEGGDATKSGISEERPVYLYNAGNKDAALKLNFDLIIPAENSPLTIQIEKGKMTENGFSKISDYSQIAINNFEHYRPFVDIFDGHLENWQIEIDSNLCEVYVKHKTDKTKIISLNKFNENQSFLSLAGSEIVDYAKAFPTSLEEIKNSAIENTIFNKVTIAPCAQNYRLKNVSLDWKHTYL